ncbi:MAG: ATP-binding cassette domain-containing protein [Bacteroidales bacterium]|jgi:ABC-type multidrug transport system ATPase subunit|nr:ATP-binding cassette domain-containing protein [Bacteroidales bacterium]
MKIEEVKLGNQLEKSISLDTTKGTLFVMTGINGSGKSTLFKMIMKLVPIKSGQIIFEEEMTYVPDPAENYFIGLTPLVYFNILQENMKISSEKFKEKLSLFSKILNFPSQLYSHQIKMLSLGEKRKVMIIGAFLMDKALMLLDEPFAGLDKESCLNLINLIDEERLRGKKFFIITHEKKELLKDIDQHIVL